MKKLIIRCRKCWENVAVVSSETEIKPCPICRQNETYAHAFIASPRKKKDQEADDDGSAGSS